MIISPQHRQRTGQHKSQLKLEVSYPEQQDLENQTEHTHCLDLKSIPRVLCNSPSRQDFGKVFPLWETQTAQEKGQNVLTFGVPQSDHSVVKLESRT